MDESSGEPVQPAPTAAWANLRWDDGPSTLPSSPSCGRRHGSLRHHEKASSRQRSGGRTASRSTRLHGGTGGERRRSTWPTWPRRRPWSAKQQPLHGGRAVRVQALGQHAHLSIRHHNSPAEPADFVQHSSRGTRSTSPHLLMAVASPCISRHQPLIEVVLKMVLACGSRRGSTHREPPWVDELKPSCTSSARSLHTSPWTSTHTRRCRPRAQAIACSTTALGTG